VPVALCTNSGPTLANGYTTTTCSTNNNTNVAVSSCSAGAPTAGNAYTTTTCAPNNTTTDVAPGSCTPSGPTAGNGYTTTSCPVIIVGPIGASTCTASGPNAGNNWTATTCPGTTLTGPTPAASCTLAIADSTNGWTATTCSTATVGPTVVTSCNPSGANATNNYTATTCAPLSGNQQATTTFTRVQQYNVSGGVQSSIGTDVTTSVGPTAAGVCYAPGAQPILPVDGTAPWTPADTTSYPSCGSWPCTVNVNTGSPQSINSLADVAQYYYITDLRTPANEPRGHLFYDDNVQAVGSGPEDDKARWQHMTTFSIALGVSGTIKYVSDYKTSAVSGATDVPIDTRFADIRVGTDTAGNVANWPLWPDPSLDYTNANNYNDPRAIDDFWHAAVNGRGLYFSAGNPTSVIAGLGGALAGITARVASSTGAGTSNLEPVPGDNFVYLASYTTQKWTGDVQAHEIDVLTGLIQAPIIWSAQSLLDAVVSNACDNRKIMLFRSGAANNLVNFTWNTQACDGGGNPTGAADTGLNAAEQANFGALNVSLLSQYPSMTDGTMATVDQRTPAAGADLVNFLRGQRGLENFTAGVAGELYRKRDHVLGDIVDGQPVYVRAPFATYTDTGYAAFAAANAGRAPMLYVAGNDGMLHAFYAGTSEVDPLGGKEAWAIIPHSVLPNLYTLADNNYQNIHRYFVDGTPTVSDVYDGANWKTLLVGGLNDGGRSFYALDVTDPANPKGMWEFNWSSTVCPANPSLAAGNTADCHVGLSFGHPLITKLNNGTWVVMVTSGYNNVNTTAQAGDGGGYLYVLNALSGQIIYKIPTNVGDAATPSGLAQINNFVDKAAINNLTVRVYGTDLLGNIWRFDVNDNTPPAGIEATLVGTATDAGGTPQPITIRPELTQVGSQPMLFVATGELLGATDVSDLQTQTIYGIIDPVVGPATAYPNLRAALAPLTMTQVGSGLGAYRTIACNGTTAQCASTDGWRIDLPDSGERVNVEMKLRSSTLVVGSNVPQISACSAGGYSWLNYLNYSSGLAVNTSAGLSVSEQVANSLIVGLTVVELQSGTMKAIVTTSDAGVLTRTIPTSSGLTNAKRVSWREIVGP
jgi:type IV pilus assembly protein PilY1